MDFKFTPDEITAMEKLINEFENDSRCPFLCGTEITVREWSINGRPCEIKFSVEVIDEDEVDDD